MSRESICPECDGNGFPADYPNRTCKMCFGSGKVQSVEQKVPRESNSERAPCQVCGRQLVPLKSGVHRNHKPLGSRGRDADYCQGSGYRAARWPVGQRLAHHAGTLWEVIEDRGGRWGDYTVRRLPGGPSWINERPVGAEMVTHGEYMHRSGWTPA